MFSDFTSLWYQFADCFILVVEKCFPLLVKLYHTFEYVFNLGCSCTEKDEWHEGRSDGMGKGIPIIPYWPSRSLAGRENNLYMSIILRNTNMHLMFLRDYLNWLLELLEDKKIDQIRYKQTSRYQDICENAQISRALFGASGKVSTAVKHVPPSNTSWRESLAEQQTGLSKKAQPKWLKIPTGHGLRTAFQITSISS